MADSQRTPVPTRKKTSVRVFPYTNSVKGHDADCLHTNKIALRGLGHSRKCPDAFLLLFQHMKKKICFFRKEIKNSPLFEGESKEVNL